MARKTVGGAGGWSEAVAAKLLYESRNTCSVCWRSRQVQIHHIVPLESGGSNEEDNGIVICANCHSEVHTTGGMTRHLGPAVLRLYKENWIALVRQYPLTTRNLPKRNKDTRLIESILKQGFRRALFFPFYWEVPDRMCKSLDDLRIFIQSSGYRLLRDKRAQDHVQQIYNSLVEIELLFGGDMQMPGHCLHGMLGRERLGLLDLRRKQICFHLNNLGTLLGMKDPIIRDDEFEQMGLGSRSVVSAAQQRQCFGNFSEHNSLCVKCEYKEECRA